MKIAFSKMHGLGNDFMVIDKINQQFTLAKEQIRALADRHFGIGFDQLLIVEAATQEKADFRYRIYNADGGEVEQCGNGARCFAHFVKNKGLTKKNNICVETLGGLLHLTIQADGLVQVDMGRVQFEPSQIPLALDQCAAKYTLAVEGQTIEFGAASIGNPHITIIVDNINTAAVQQIGPLLTKHKLFPQGVNVGFMQLVSSDEVKLRVYERGAGETLACGSGACAAVAIGINQGILSNTVKVDLAGGNLMVSWNGSDHSVLLTGPATHVFEGHIEL